MRSNQNKCFWFYFSSIFWLCLVLLTQTYAAGNPLAGEKKSLICSACHGEKGISSNPEWPHLAGQHAGYLLKQLTDFKRETRQAPMMAPLVANLSTEDMADLAAYYAQLPCTINTVATTQTMTRGQRLYQEGEREQKITACITCHGPDGRGNAEANFPSLQHQSAIYLAQQLHAFKSQYRKNDLNGLMHDISQHLNDDDIKALSDYIANIPE